MNLPAHVDVAICGAGPVGSALALALRDAGRSVALVDERATGPVRDARAIALSQGSRLILERLGIDWWTLQPTPIVRIHVSNLGEPGRAVLTAEECAVPALGYVASYDRLCAAFETALANARIERVAPVRVARVSETAGYAAIECEAAGVRETLTAEVAAIADGARGLALPTACRTFDHDYAQTAFVTDVASDRPHAGTAFERFTRHGPLALLPHGERYSVVWTLPAGAAQDWLARPADEVLLAMQSDIGERAGRLTDLGSRSMFPLRLRIAFPGTARRIALVGNAAQSLHPVAGQGFNLGLRDAWTLGQALSSGDADASAVARWRSRRQLDRLGSVAVTHGLVSLFGSDRATAARARSAGLTLIDALPPARRWFARRMMYGAAL